MPSKAPETKAERTLNRLVSATIAEISDTGSFTGDRVAKRAEVSPATFYVRFESKEAALAAAFEATMDELIELVARHWNIERLLNDGLTTLCEHAAHACIEYFRQHAMMFRLALAELPNSKSIRDAYRRGEDYVFDHFEQFITLGQRAGYIRTDDVSVMARTHLILTQGLNNPNAIHSDEQTEISKAYAQLMVAHLRPN